MVDFDELGEKRSVGLNFFESSSFLKESAGRRG
jgi:hypothetical protein